MGEKCLHTCSFNACIPEELEAGNVYARLQNLSTAAPALWHLASNHSGVLPDSTNPSPVKQFLDCMGRYEGCSEEDVSDPESQCSTYSLCNPPEAEGQYCGFASQLLGARVLYCAAKHLILNTGHVFDFFASFGGFAAHTTSGFTENENLIRSGATYLFASIEADYTMIPDKSVYPGLHKNLEGRNYVLLRNAECLDTFDMKPFVDSLQATLEMILVDLQPSAVDAFDVAFPQLEDPKSKIQVIVMQRHGSANYGSNLVDRLEGLIAEGKWARIYSKNPYYEWSWVFSQREDTLMEVYVRM